MGRGSTKRKEDRISHLTANRNKRRILLCCNLGLFLWKRKDDSEGRAKSTEPGVIENDSQGVGLNWAIIKKVALAYGRTKVDRRGREKEDRKGDVNHIPSSMTL